MGNTNGKVSEEDVEKMNFSEKGIQDLFVDFEKRYPKGSMTKEEFIKDNMELKGGEMEFWGSIFDSIDVDQNGHVDFKEYIVLLTLMSKKGSSQDYLEFLFHLFDLNKDGVLDENEIGLICHVFFKKAKYRSSLQEVLLNHGDHKKKEENLDFQEFRKSLFQLMDQNHNGYVNESDFVSICLKEPIVIDALSDVLSQYEVYKNEDLYDVRKLDSKESHQVGGHRDIIYLEDLVYKPLVQEEFDFYEEIYRNSDEKNEKNPTKRKVCQDLIAITPKFFGKRFLKFQNNNNNKKKNHKKTRSHKEGEGGGGGDGIEYAHYLVLENLVKGMKKPCCIDIKMGREGYARAHSNKIHKKLYQGVVKHVSTQSKFGFRLSGVRVYKKTTNSFIKMKKNKGSTISASKCQDTFVDFINNGKKIRTEIYENALPKIKTIQQFFQNQKLFDFFSSSILLFYDGASDDDHNECIVKFVDFAHVFHSEKEEALDDDVLFGINSLINILQGIVKAHGTKEQKKEQKQQQEEILEL